MANVEHSVLTTTNLHENKGVSTATDNTVATAVTGATVWAKLTASNLTGTGNSFGGQLLHVRDEKASGTNGGNFSAGSFLTRTLQTTKTNEIASASLASNQVSLPAGTYFIDAIAPAKNIRQHQTRWQNITDASTTLTGNITETDEASGNNSYAHLRGRFTIAGTKLFELQHRCAFSNLGGTGFGAAGSFGTEVYSDVLIWKVL